MSLVVKDVKELQEQLEATQYEPPTRHNFVDGMYMRETLVFAGTLGIGATHKKCCFNLLVEGEILVSDGTQEVRLKAPQSFIGNKGEQKYGLALTDVVWVNVFRTDATNVVDAERELFEEEIYKEKQWVDSLQRQ